MNFFPVFLKSLKSFFLFEILIIVNKKTLNFSDMFTGDSVKNEVERSIRNLRPSLQKRLRFITHINIDESNLIITE